MVFQAALDGHDRLEFRFVGGGCAPLLGLRAAVLRRDPAQFEERILAADRACYRCALRRLRTRGRELDWEGRVSVGRRGEVKWISLRAAVRRPRAGQLLCEGFALDVTQRRKAEASMRASQARLRELSAHLQAAKEEERAMIAREIHDDVGGLLTAAWMHMRWLARRLPDAQPDLAGTGTAIVSHLDRAIDATQRIARNLRPGVLDFGIAPAIEWLARDFQKRHGIPCVLRRMDEDTEACPELATALFRILQEGLNNVAKHASARAVEISLSREPGCIFLELRDNGIGLREEDADKPGAFGLRSMRERMQALGGSIRITGIPGRGTHLVARAPLKKKENDK